jgi:hypothetical protein
LSNRDPDPEKPVGSDPPPGSPYGFHQEPGGPGLEHEMEQLRQQATTRREVERADEDAANRKRPWWRFWKR